MSWVKLDDQMADHPKVRGLGELAPLALALQVRALCYAARYLTDGALSHGAIPGLLDSFAALSSEANWPALMVKAGLWERAKDGYAIHDYLKYNPTRESVLVEREANAKRQKDFRDRNKGSNDVTPSLVQRPRTRTRTPEATTTTAAAPPVQDVAAPEKRDASPGKPRSPYAELMPLVRQFLWIPDGTPPADWDDRREGSVLKALLERQPLREIKIAIEGLALLRDAPGMWADAVSWMHPGEKLTCRALYNTRSGVTQTFALAHRAYWKHATYSKTRRTNVTPSDISSDELVPR